MNRFSLAWLSPPAGLEILDDRIITLGNKNFHGPKGLPRGLFSVAGYLSLDDDSDEDKANLRIKYLKLLNNNNEK